MSSTLATSPAEPLLVSSPPQLQPLTLTTPNSTSAATTLSSPTALGSRPTSHSFSLQRPLLAEDVKRTRNSKRLSLLVPPSPGKMETLATIAAAAHSPSFPQQPNTPSSSSFATSLSMPSLLSQRRPFAVSAPISLPVMSGTTVRTITAATTPTIRQSQIWLDQALPNPRTSLPSNATAAATPSPAASLPPGMMRQQRRRPISAYYSDFSVECGVASPYSAQPVSVLPHLFLGAEHNAMDVTTLNKLGITGVLNVAVEIAEDEEKEKESESTTTKSTIVTVQGKHSSPTNSNNHGIQYKSLAWTHHQQNLLSEFPEGFEFIDGIRSEGGKVLVHCQLGVSRSASMVIAYVMKTREMGLTDAYDFVKARSAVISPNMGLMYQLAEFEKSLTKKTAPSTNAGFPDLRDDDEEVYPYPTESEMEKRQEQQQEQQSPQRQEKQRSRLSRLSISAPSKSDISMEVPSTPMSLTFAFPTATPQHQSTSPPLPTATKTTSPITTRPRSSQFRMAIPVPLEVLRSSAVKDEALLSTRTFLSLSTTMATKDEDEDAMVLAPPTPLFFAEGIVSNSSSSSSPTTSTSSSRSSFAISGSSRPSSTSSAASSFINSTPFATSGVTSATTSTKMETKEILMGPLPVSQDPMTSETEDPSFATKTTAAPPPLPAVATPTPIVVAAPVPMRAHRPSLPVMASSQAQAKRTVLLRAYTQDKIGLDSHTPQHQQQPHQHYYHPSLSQHTPSSASIASSSRRSHTLATVLTRPWSNFHNSHAQQPPQQPPQPQHFFPHFARQASTVSSPSKVQDTGTGADIIDSNSAPRIRSQTVDSGGELFLVDKNSPEFIFSPRPFSPPPQSLLAASTVVDPVTTPSASTTPSTTGRIRSFGGFYQPLRMEG